MNTDDTKEDVNTATSTTTSNNTGAPGGPQTGATSIDTGVPRVNETISSGMTHETGRGRAPGAGADAAVHSCEFPSVMPQLPAVEPLPCRLLRPSGAAAEYYCVPGTRQVFEVGRRLADSIYGAVHVGFTVEQNPETGAYQRVNADGSGRVALKRMSRSKIEELRRRGVGDDPFAEARLLRFANARNDLFVELLALLITDDEVIMVTEFMEGGDLLSAISDHRPGTFTHAEVRVIATRVALALHFLHELGLCNNDLSMENILVKYKNDGSGAPFVVKVIDVGMARQMPRLLSAAAVDADPYAFGRFSSYVSPGKAKYAAVEALGSYVGWRNDMWALGVVGLYEYPAESICPSFRYLRRQGVLRVLDAWSRKRWCPDPVLDDHAREAVSHLVCDEGTRWSAATLLQHRWLSHGPAPGVLQRWAAGDGVPPQRPRVRHVCREAAAARGMEVLSDAELLGGPTGGAGGAHAAADARPPA